MIRYRSPGGPPRSPGSPLPASRMRLPSLTPAGMLTRKRLTVRTAPEPPQVGQGSSMIVPEPPHCEHGWEMENIPWPWVSMPRPSQRGQMVGVVPGARRCRGRCRRCCAIGTDSGTCAPATAWSKVIETSASRSAPRSAPGAPPAPAGAAASRPRTGWTGCRPSTGVEVEVAEAAEAAAGPAAWANGPAARVVLLALLGVAEDVVGLGDLLEACLGLLVPRVAVGVVLRARACGRTS